MHAPRHSNPAYRLLCRSLKVLVGTLASYSVRFFIYANMKSSLYGLPAEALRGATFALFWSTATIYAHQVSPPGMSATLLAIMNGMYGGLGQSVGAILGGKLQGMLGTVGMFNMVGTLDCIFVALMAIYFGIRRPVAKTVNLASD